jgi:hypothetical protein
MTRVFLAAVALAALPLGARAEDATVRLTVRPMSAPKPALKYQLLPELRELNPGNPAQNYLKCFAEQRNFFYGKEAVAARARYQSIPLAELPADKLRDYGGSALRQADWAARLDTPDWQVLPRLHTDGLNLLVAELGPLRLLAASLQVRFRGHVAGRRFDEAVRSAQTMFALARHLGDYPTEAADLVGLSTADLTLDTLEEMVQQSGCPNLYWALTDLPCPLVDLRKGVQGERTLVAADLDLLADDAPMTDAQIEQFVSRLSGVMSFAREQAGQPPQSLRTELAARVEDAEKVRAARRRLVEAGCPEKRVQKFPAAQAILLDAKHQYEIGRDEELKLLNLPAWRIEALTADADRSPRPEGLLVDLLPHIRKLRWLQVRLEQRIALLRHVEALRLYAAAHDGKLPEKLTDIAVPLPEDPFTGKPFPYKREGSTAHLRGSAPRGEESNPRFNIRYAVAIP